MHRQVNECRKELDQEDDRIPGSTVRMFHVEPFAVPDSLVVEKIKHLPRQDLDDLVTESIANGFGFLRRLVANQYEGCRSFLRSIGVHADDHHAEFNLLFGLAIPGGSGVPEDWQEKLRKLG
jgi:hypothetical protein